MGTFSGVSPLLAEEARLRAKPPLTAESLWYGLNDILTCVRVSEYEPRIWGDGAGGTLGAYPVPLLSVPAPRQFPRVSLSRALDEAAASSERRGTFTHTRDALQAALHRALRARLHEQEEVRKGLANADRADEYQQSGELLLAQPHADPCGRGAGGPAGLLRAATGGRRPADPRRGAGPGPGRAGQRRTLLQEGAQGARQPGKPDAAAGGLDRRKFALLTEAEQDAQAATAAEQIAALRESLASSLGNSQKQSGEAGDERERQTPAFEGYKIKTFHSPDGWEILVGENATSNDYLTTRVAAPSDIWLHVRAATSAHGVIRARNRPAAVSPAAIQQAASLVAARSEVKHSSLIPVDYTLRKYVRKPRRSAPGAVTYQNEKTINVAGI